MQILTKAGRLFLAAVGIAVVSACGGGGDNSGDTSGGDNSGDTTQSEPLTVAIAWNGDSALSFNITSPSGRQFVFGDAASSAICDQRDDQEVLNPPTGQRVVECPVADLEPGEYIVTVRNGPTTSTTYNVFVVQGDNQIQIADAVLIFNSVGAGSHTFQLGDNLDLGGSFTAGPASAAQPTLVEVAIKRIAFNWTDVPDATFYRLLENPDGASGFPQLGNDIASGTESVLHFLPLFERVNASYILQSCNVAACVNSNEIFLGSAAMDLIGYFKADTGNPTPTDGALFGSAISVSADGRTLAVGAPSLGSGTVYVFSMNNVIINTVWRLQATITGPSDPGARFGAAVSLNDDGTRLAIGADGENNATGAVYIYEAQTRADFSGQDWTQIDKLTGTDFSGPSDLFGEAISLSGDGDWLAVGAVGDDNDWVGVNPPNANDDRPDSGAVYIFRDSNIGSDFFRWSIIKADNPGFNDLFGSSVSLNTDGTTLAVGAVGEASNSKDAPNDDSLQNAGAVYVFKRNSTSGAYEQQQRLKSLSIISFYEYGSAVSLSGDGATLVVGAPSSINMSPRQPGLVEVQTLSGSVWSRSVTFDSSDSLGFFGQAVDISKDGNYIAIGEPSGAPAAGKVSISKRQADDSWSFPVDLISPLPASVDLAGDVFGVSVSISDNGDTLAVGSSGEDGDQQLSGTLGASTVNDNAPDTGAVFLY